jgi:hypothetical protein
MIGIAIAACASLFAASALLVTVRHSQILVEIGFRTILVMALLLMPLAPVVMLVGAARMGVIPGAILASACCLPSLFIARKAIRALEREDSYRVKDVLEAMSRLMGMTIAMLALVAVATIIAIAVDFLPNMTGGQL